jgi:hypothetical protein
MKPTVIARDREELSHLIKTEMSIWGSNCDLNHIDVSKVGDMIGLFMGSRFNGNISKWDVSNVRNMAYMFTDSKFNGDISQWNVSNVKDMSGMFQKSEFEQDINNWLPKKLTESCSLFSESKVSLPYWANFENNEQILKVINTYLFQQELQQDLSKKDIQLKKIKI